MAIHRIRQIPTELPNAILYLDDIDEISNILLDAAAPVYAKLKEHPKISYAIGDTKMDSIEDLRVHGGNTTNLEIGVGSFGGPGVKFSYFLNPYMRLHGLDVEQAWATYGKVRSIFDRRQLRIRNAIESLPGWLKWSLWCLLALTPEAIRHTGHPISFLTGYILLCASVGYVLYLQPSRVFFARSHERTRKSSEERRKNVREIAILVVGGVIGGLIIELIHPFLPKLFTHLAHASQFIIVVSFSR